MRESIRVATLNLWGRFAEWPRRRAILTRELPPLDVDVYFLQEVVCGDGRGDQLAELAELLGHEWQARVIAENRPHEREDEGVAILSRLPLHDVAVWPLPPSHPPRHRLEATVEGIRLVTLHAAVSRDDGRDAQIECLGAIRDSPLVLGSDLNAPPSIVRPRVRDLEDTLGWDESPTWPVDRDEFLRAWKEKLGNDPEGNLEPRRMDYLLVRGIDVLASESVALRENGRSASDHRLVWADVRGGARADPGASTDV